MQQENWSFHESIAHLQGNQTLATFGSTLKEP
jgi:DNA-binding FadR family transcriptional regulator